LKLYREEQLGLLLTAIQDTRVSLVSYKSKIGLLYMKEEMIMMYKIIHGLAVKFTTNLLTLTKTASILTDSYSQPPD